MVNSKLTVVNPSTGEQIAILAMDDAPAAALKLRQARERFENRTSQLSLHERVQLLEQTAQLMQNEAEELALCIAREGGKPLADARVEVTRAIAGVRIAIAEVSGQHGHVIPLGSEHASSGRRVFTQKFLRGVVLAFSAFNHPLNLIDLNTELDEALKAANLHPHAFQAAVYASNIESINKATPCSMLRQL